MLTDLEMHRSSLTVGILQEGKCTTNLPWEEYEEGMEDIVATDFTQLVAQLRAANDSSQKLVSSLCHYHPVWLC